MLCKIKKINNEICCPNLNINNNHYNMLIIINNNIKIRSFHDAS